MRKSRATRTEKEVRQQESQNGQMNQSTLRSKADLAARQLAGDVRRVSGMRGSWRAIYCGVRHPSPLAARPVAAEAPVLRPSPVSTPDHCRRRSRRQKKCPLWTTCSAWRTRRPCRCLTKLKSDPKNPQLWNQVGLIYKSAHQFKQAAGYFEKSLQYNPKDIGVRADYASCLYYTGDVDGALAQLNQSLTYDPQHAGTLMNIGIIKWRGKNDVDGAVAAWEKLLQYHPDFPQKDLVQQMITQAKQGTKAPSQEPKG